MEKRVAIELLGGCGPGAQGRAAERIGVTVQAVRKWPDPLPERIKARVIAELAMEYLPKKLSKALGLR